MARPRVEIHGYAIISDDDMIAAADGLLPTSMRNPADWELYQRRLANSDLVVFARVSHEAEPNTRGDPRVVVSRDAAGLELRSDGWWWNPARVPWAQVVETLLPQGGEVAAPGGQAVFDLFLGIGYDVFHLSRAHGIRLPGGRPIFSACASGRRAEDVLRDAGLTPAEYLPLDLEHGVDMRVWRTARPE